VLIVDTGPFVAAADTSDPAYQRCRQLLESHPGPLITTPLVIAEAGWLIRRQLDVRAEALLYRTIADGQIDIETLTNADWARIAEVVDRYAAIGLDAADASIVAIAERLDQKVIATLDERDFRIVRPAHTDTFELLPGPT
jgi:predicted nucleic acid-binding protein